MWHGGMLGQFAELPEGGRADPQQATDLPRSVDRSRLKTLGPEQLPELGLRPVPEIGGRIAPAMPRKPPGARSDALTGATRYPGSPPTARAPLPPFSRLSHLSTLATPVPTTGLPIPLVPLPLPRRILGSSGEGRRNAASRPRLAVARGMSFNRNTTRSSSSGPRSPRTTPLAVITAGTGPNWRWTRRAGHGSTVALMALPRPRDCWAL